jgi:EAL and modified HD-GYP domain-containing signal transduction protein
LLYCPTPAAAASGAPRASSHVLTDGLLGFGQGELTRGRPAFVPFTRELLLSGGAVLAAPESLVVEVSDEVTVDAEVVDACRDLHGRGYPIGLRDFVQGSSAEELLPYAKYVKTNVAGTPAPDVTPLVTRFSPTGIAVVAEGVETPELAARVRGQGCQFVQGFHFCKPAAFPRTPLPSRQLMYLQLLNALNRESASVRELEDVIKHDPSLTLQILRAVNSSATGVRHEVTSVGQALLLLGRDRVRKWASVLTLTGMNNAGNGETVVIALLRARCCELLGPAMGASDTGFFFLGMCSLLDVIVGRPMATVIADLPLPPMIADALLGARNKARTLLDAIVAHEQGNWSAAASALATLGVAFDMLPAAYADAVRWSHELWRGES